MDLADMAYIHLFLGILLVPLMGLDGAQGPCPTLCRCSLEILNCSRITDPPGFNQVPLPTPEVHPHPFTYLDFTGNAISSIGKEVWNAYPWAEHLILKDNSLSRLQNSSLEGLLSLTYLDLSCNKIQIVERNAFEAVPFLQVINLSSNIIERIPQGTFQAWHGMQFLLKVDLSHNPLAVIQDSYFYSLPSLKLLDLGATEVTPRILEDLLQTSLRLRTLVLPKKMSCCLCHIKEDIEVLCETIHLQCTESCDISATLCENEEPLNRMQEEVMKVLKIRKGNGISLLTISPAGAESNNGTPERAERDNDTLVLTQNYPSLAANFNLLQSVKRLMQTKADEPLDMNWVDKRELKKLYLLASLLQAALKEKIVNLDKVSPEETIQNELSDQVLEKPTEEARKKCAETSNQKERHVRKVTRENWLGRYQRQKGTLFRLGRQVAKTATQSVDKSSVFESHNKAESWRKRAKGLDSQRTLSFLRSHEVAVQSSQKRSISDSLTNALKPASYMVVGNDDNDLTSLSNGENSVAVLRKGLGIQILTNEELLNSLPHRSDHPAGDGNPDISASDSEPSLTKLLPDMLPQGTYGEHQKFSVSPPLGFLAEDDSLIQGELFENELNEKLISLIPNTPVRKLISHVIRVLKMDCSAPTLQMACAKLISRTGLLMKLLSENANETPTPWKSYFSPPMHAANMTTASSRKLEKPSERTASQGIPAYGYGNMLLLAISVTAITLIIISVICLIRICSRRSADKDGTFLGRGKKALPDEELPRTPSLLMDNKPLWLKDMYHIQDEMQKNNMVDKLHDEESLEEMDWGNARPSGPPPNVEKPSSVPTLELLIPIIPPTPAPPEPALAPTPTPSQKSSEKNVSDKSKGSSQATSSKAAAAADEGEGEDAVSSAEKSENPTISEAPESGEEDEEDEDEESE